MSRGGDRRIILDQTSGSNDNGKQDDHREFNTRE